MLRESSDAIHVDRRSWAYTRVLIDIADPGADPGHVESACVRTIGILVLAPGSAARLAARASTPAAEVTDDRTSSARNFQLLVSRLDRRYHAVWSDNIAVAAAEPLWQPLPAAVCGQLACEPRDSRSPMPEACDCCFHLLQEKYPGAECSGAPRRNLAGQMGRESFSLQVVRTDGDSRMTFDKTLVGRHRRHPRKPQDWLILGPKQRPRLLRVLTARSNGRHVRGPRAGKGTEYRAPPAISVDTCSSGASVSRG